MKLALSNENEKLSKSGTVEINLKILRKMDNDETIIHVQERLALNNKGEQKKRDKPIFMIYPL